MKIHLTRQATDDLYAVETYVRKDNLVAAVRIVNRIFDVIEHLGEFPGIGRIGRVFNTRELIVSNTPFIVVYQVRNSEVFGLRVIHTARKWED